MAHIDPWWISSVGVLVCTVISESSFASLAKCSVVPLSALLPTFLAPDFFFGINVAVVVAMVIVLYLVYYTYSSTARVRRMSFMTDTIVGGPFPDEIRSPDPIIGTILFFEKLPAIDAIKNTFRAFLKYERFTCYPKKFLFWYQWTKPDFFEYDKHFIKVRVHNDQQLRKYVDETMTKKTRQGNQQPQWEVHIIGNPRGHSAILVRISHIVGDGVSFVSLMDKVFKDKNGYPLKMEAPISRSAGVAAKGARGGIAVFIKKLVQSAIDVLKMPISNFDSTTAFSAREPGEFVFTTHRHAVMFPILSLASVKAIKEAANVTVNDVMMTAMAGCIRRYCIAHADPSVNDPNLQTRALIPVAFGRLASEAEDDQAALRNKWCLVSADMHIQEPDCKKRLLQICQTMTTIKTTPVAPVTMWFQDNVLHWLPRIIAQKASYDSFSRHSMVFSNVPGPQQAMYFADEQLLSIQVLYPNLLPQVIALSYNGGIFMNIVVDPQLITNSDDLPTYFVEELVGLARAYNLKLTAGDMLLSELDVARESSNPRGASVAGEDIPEHKSVKTWKTAAGRTDGSDGFHFGDFTRYAIRSMSGKKRTNYESRISEGEMQLLK